jgi:hypothetical protein
MCNCGGVLGCSGWMVRLCRVSHGGYAFPALDVLLAVSIAHPHAVSTLLTSGSLWFNYPLSGCLHSMDQLLLCELSSEFSLLSLPLSEILF